MCRYIPVTEIPEGFFQLWGTSHGEEVAPLGLDNRNERLELQVPLTDALANGASGRGRPSPHRVSLLFLWIASPSTGLPDTPSWKGSHQLPNGATRFVQTQPLAQEAL